MNSLIERVKTAMVGIEFAAGQLRFWDTEKKNYVVEPGDYEVQAVLDVDHSYNYKGRETQDWISPVVALQHWTPGEGAEPVLRLTGHPEEDPARVAMLAKAKAEVRPGEVQLEQLQSALLTQFWGRPTFVKAWVVLPPGYTEHSGERYPTAYWTHGFGGRLDLILGVGAGASRTDEGRQDASDDLGDDG